ncbi:hypothetical protein AMK68_02540 [candidate division KD3-62 bacterium DG_56]|uniref:Uncharacterized protein n=1 Tax=candidate division KD3-62 bacterium DG_56 TaxID=1704032 RepID=A0A0S7XNQ8_9BACT|nr:MAG: hypothetical protein AMK68_02540 [candidate division KD3-62 bacterium DG_56]
MPSRGAAWGSWHGDEWDLERHAEYVEGLYTLAHGKPFVDAIRWFSFSDRQFTDDTGLVVRSLDQAKPAYEKVIQLAERWTTAEEGTTGADGIFRFRGHLGDYEISVIRDGAPVARQAVDLCRGTGPQRVVMSVP